MMFSLISLLVLLAPPPAHAARVPKGVEVEPQSITSTAGGRNEVRLKMAEMLIDKGQTTEARQLLDAAITEGGVPRGEIELLQGRALAFEGLSGAALERLEDARKAMPHDARPLRAIGLLQADTGHVEEALLAFEKATRLDDSDGATWNNYGFLLMSAKRFEEARSALERAVTLDGGVPRYRRNLGFALAALGRDREALAALRGAGTEADAQADFALACEMAGDNAKAIEHYRAALSADDSHDVALEGLERLANPIEETP